MTEFLEKIENILVQNGGKDYQFHWSIAADMCDEAGEEVLADAIRYFLSEPKEVSVKHKMEEHHDQEGWRVGIIYRGTTYECQGISSETVVGLVNSIYLAEQFGAKLHSRPFIRME